MKTAHRIYASLILGGLLSASPLTLSMNQTTHFALQAEAATEAKKVTGQQLLLEMLKSIVVIADDTKKLKPEERAHMEPYFKALSKTIDDINSLDKAAKAHATKEYSKAVLATAESMGRLDATYSLAHSNDKLIGAAMRQLGNDWRVYLRNFGGGKGGTPDTAKKNARRIAALHKHLEHLAKKRDAHPSEKKQITEMIAKLDKAALVNRSNGNQWLTLAIMNDVTGWYGGYYDYYLVYDPNIASYYKNGYHYFQEVSTRYEAEYESYYTEYSWSSYEASVEVTATAVVSTDAVVVAEIQAEDQALVTAEESVAETAISSVETEITTEVSDSSTGTQEAQTIDSAEAAANEAPADTFVDPADVANEEADAQAVQEVSDAEAEASYDQVGEADNSEMADEEPADGPDDSEPDAGGDSEE